MRIRKDEICCVRRAVDVFRTGRGILTVVRPSFESGGALVFSRTSFASDDVQRCRSKRGTATDDFPRGANAVAVGCKTANSIPADIIVTVRTKQNTEIRFISFFARDHTFAQQLSWQFFLARPSIVSSSSQTYLMPSMAPLDYQQYPTPGNLRVGRYIDRDLPSEPTHCDQHLQVDVDVRSARGLKTRLDREGFTLVNHPLPGGANFDDEASIKASYYEEVQNLVRRETGAATVYVFDHTLRCSSVQKLNALAQTSAAAGSVIRVHCDYTADSAPLRFRQLGHKESYTGAKVSLSTVEDIIASGKRFAFINVWRSIDRENPVHVKPLAVCDWTSIDPDNELLLYELVYKDRVGENYSLSPENASQHRWYYYPKMTADEAILFKVYDRHRDKAPFVFHTAFPEPNTPEDALSRKSIECRTIVVWSDETVPRTLQTRYEVRNNRPQTIFYDMVHSNNAARVRLWLQLKKVPEEAVKVRMITYADLQDPNYADVNPLKKCPAMLTWRKKVKALNIVVDENNAEAGEVENKDLVAGSKEPEGRGVGFIWVAGSR